MNKADFYQQHLNRVSRSFAFSISILDQPLREYVGLTYLLCRLIDTYEDSPWTSKESQLNQLEALKQVLAGTVSLADFDVKPKELLKIKDSEALLLKDSTVLFADYFALPPKIHEHVRKLVFTMIDGMSHFIKKNPKAKIRIKSLSQLNQYCLFVAGIVGECLTGFTQELANKKKISKAKQKNALLFGLFLQKINILKDQAQDEKEGRFFLPSRQLVFKSVIKHVEQAKNYIHSIPDSQGSYKVFCLSAFLLGLKTLEIMNPKKPETVKVSRAEAEKIFQKLIVFASNKSKLNQFVKEFQKQLPKDILRSINSKNDDMSLALYNRFQRQNAGLI